MNYVDLQLDVLVDLHDLECSYETFFEFVLLFHMAPSVEEMNESNEGTRLKKQDCHSLPNYDHCYGRHLFFADNSFLLLLLKLRAC